jgi:glycosyltransferase involved in cell wall biosynthesis
VQILFFSHYFPPEGNAPANRTYENCVRWVRAGHQVTVVTCAPNVPDGIVYPGYRNRLWPQHEVVDGIQVVRVWTWLAPNAGVARRILNFVSYLLMAVLAVLLRRRPDVVIATSPQFFCGWAGVIVSWLKWRPFVLEIRDIWPESITTVGAMRRGVAIRGLEVLERWMYRAATHIVAVGTGYRDKILEKADVADRIRVIPNGVDLQAFAPVPASPAFRERWAPGDRLVCSYVGTLGMAHGLDVVVRAAARLRAAGSAEICLLLVGDGAQRAVLEADVAEQGLQDLVRFTGRLPREEMPEVLASSDVSLVHLRGTELFGTVIPSKIFETMAMQCPIIMGVKGPARDIVMEAGAGVAMEPDDDAQLADLLLRMADDRQWLESLAKNGREYVAEHYNRDTLAAEYLELLQAVVCREPAASTKGIPQRSQRSQRRAD